jgi:hypothetical protein
MSMNYRASWTLNSCAQDHSTPKFPAFTAVGNDSGSSPENLQQDNFLEEFHEKSRDGIDR